MQDQRSELKNHSATEWEHDKNRRKRWYGSKRVPSSGLRLPFESPYLKAMQSPVDVDHSALNWILNLAEAMEEPANWSLRSSHLDFKVFQPVEIPNQTADELLGLRTRAVDTIQRNDDAPA